MELHRNDRGTRRLSLVGLGYGAAAILAGTLFAVLGAGVGILALFLWISGGFFALVGLYVFGGSTGRFRIALLDTGLAVHTTGCDFEGPWEAVDGISVERVVLPNLTADYLVLWLPEGSPVRQRPRFSGHGRKGYRLVELKELVETPEQVVEALQRYAGPRFRAPAAA